MAPVDNPLDLFFDLVPTGAALYTPVFDEHNDLVDFRFVRLNPAGQRLLGLPAQPPRTFREYYPNSVPTGIFAQYRTAYLTGESSTYDVPYLGDGIDTYFHLVAQRSGELLVVNFTDMAALPRSAVEQSLRESRAREQAARAEAERQRGELERVFEQAPVAIAVYRGPRYTIELANPTVARLWGRTREQLLGKGLFEALPEVAGMGYEELLDGVMATGVPHVAHAMEAQHERDGHLETVFWDFVYVPMYAADGHIDGAMVVATEVTTQVRARQQVEQLNQELEIRVQARTRELAGQQRLLNQILEQVPAAITTLSGPDHRYTFANARYQQLVEGRVQVGQTVAETLPEVTEQGFVELLDNVYHKSQPFEGKEIALMLAQPGSPPVQHYIDFTYQPMPDEQGQTQGILVFAVDVTEQVRSQRQSAALQTQLLAAAQHQATERLAFYHIFEQTPALIALLRAPGHRFEYVNPTYQAVFAGRQLVGHNVAEAVPELRDQGFVALLDHVYQTGETYFGQELPFTPLPAPGQPPRPAYYNFTYQAYRENGEVAGITIFANDVTEQVLARQEREAQRQEFTQLFMQAPAPIVILDGPDLVFQLVNPAYQRIFPGRELAGKPLLEALPELIGTPIPDLFRRVYQTGEPITVQDLPLQMSRYEGHALEEIYWTFTYQARRAIDGHIDGVRVFAHDVTEQVRVRQQVESLNQELTATNAELHTSNTQLTRTNADLDTFVYAASHDLKAPIANIEGLLDILREYLPADEQPPMVPRVLGMMQGAISRFQQTVGHLTDVARLQFAPDLVADEVDVPQLLEDVRLDLLPLLESTQARLHTQIEACPRVHLQARNMRSILFNLLSNALKYRAPDRLPVVEMRTDCTPTHYIIEVQDNGLGLSEEQQSNLFVMFRRLHTHVEGSGVGLYLIRRMIELAGGSIAVQSAVGVGSTFTVTLPRAERR